MAVFVPVRESESSSWGRLILFQNRSQHDPIQLTAQVEFVEEPHVARQHLLRLRDCLVENLPPGSNHAERLEQACPSVVYIAEHGTFRLGVAAQRSWEMGYLLSCLEESGDFVPEADVDHWATGMLDLDSRRFYAREEELREKYGYICSNVKRRAVLLSPVDLPNTLNVTVRRIETVYDLALFVQTYSRQQRLQDNDPVRLALKDICATSPGRDDHFVERHVLVRQPHDLAAHFLPAQAAKSAPEKDSLTSAMAAHERFVIRGGPGAGKAWALQRCEYILAKRALADENAPFPIRLDASQVAEGDTFENLLRSGRRRHELPVGRPIAYLVDNLDRLDRPRLLQAFDLLESPAYPRLIFADDLSAHRHELPAVSFELLDLDDDQVRHFVSNALGPAEGATFLGRMREIDERDGRSAGVRAVLGNPRLLQLVCDKAEDFADLEVTQTIGLPADILRMLANQILARAGRAGRQSPTLSELSHSLGAHALASLGIEVPVPEALADDDDVARAKIAVAVQCGFLDDEGDFRLDSWRDLIASAFLVQVPAFLPMIIDPPRIVHGELWPQIVKPLIVHMVRMVEDPNPVLTSIVKRDPFLALDALQLVPDGKKVSKETRTAIINGLVTYLKHDDKALYELACDALVGFGPDAVAPLRAVVENTDAEDWWRARVVDILGQLDCVEAFVALAFALKFPGRVSKRARRIFRSLYEEERRLLETAIREHIANLRPIEEAQKIGKLMANCWRGVEEGLICAVGAALGLDVMPFLVTSASGATVMTSPAIAKNRTAAIPGRVSRGEFLDAAAPVTVRKAGEQDPSFTRSWTDAWAERSGDPTLVLRALIWLRSGFYNHGSWPYIWVPLFRFLPENSELYRCGREWLDNNELDNRSWPFVWNALYERYPTDRDLRALGSTWLDRSPRDHRSWGYVWKPLFDAEPDPVLKQQGLQYLREQSIASPSFTYVWRSMWLADPDDGDLLRYAERWFAQPSLDNAGWGFVWPPLWRHFNDRGYHHQDAVHWRHYLEEVGSKYLEEGRRSSAAWAYIFQGMWDHGRDEHLTSIGLEWLRVTTPANGAFSYIWDRLQKARRHDEELTEIGIRAMKTLSVGHPSWPTLWNGLMSRKCAERLIPYQGHERRLGEFGFEVLSELPLYDSAWCAIWANVHRFQMGDPRVFARGCEWLRGAKVQDTAMGYVLVPLIKEAPADPWLRKYALDWLIAADARHPSWGRVWLAMKKEDGDGLLEAGLRWLQSGTWRHNEWSRVWEAMRTRAPANRGHLIALAAEWLERVPVREKGRMRILNSLAKADPGLPAVRKWVAQSLLASLRSSVDPRDVTFPQTTAEWQNLWATLENNENLRSDILRELRDWICEPGASETGAFPFVWKGMFDVGFPEEAFIALGRDWLRRTPIAARGWALVWASILSVSDDSDELLDLAWPWMHVDHWTRSSWPVVWMLLREKVPERAQELDALACDFVVSVSPTQQKVSEHLKDFCRVWLALVASRGLETASKLWGQETLALLPDDDTNARRIRDMLNT